MDTPNRIPWPPIVYLAALLAGLALNWYLPLPWPARPLRFVLAAIGLCAIGLAVALDIAAFRLFRRHRTTIMPHRAASALITEGPFARSRNPIYVGNTLLVSGLGLLFGVAWLVPAALLAAFAVQKLAIEREEAHLAEKFGEAWRDYAARTPRWLFF